MPAVDQSDRPRRRARRRSLRDNYGFEVPEHLRELYEKFLPIWAIEETERVLRWDRFFLQLRGLAFLEGLEDEDDESLLLWLLSYEDRWRAEEVADARSDKAAASGIEVDEAPADCGHLSLVSRAGGRRSSDGLEAAPGEGERDDAAHLVSPAAGAPRPPPRPLATPRASSGGAVEAPTEPGAAASHARSAPAAAPLAAGAGNAAVGSSGEAQAAARTVASPVGESRSTDADDAATAPLAAKASAAVSPPVGAEADGGRAAAACRESSAAQAPASATPAAAPLPDPNAARATPAPPSTVPTPSVSFPAPTPPAVPALAPIAAPSQTRAAVARPSLPHPPSPHRRAPSLSQAADLRGATGPLVARRGSGRRGGSYGGAWEFGRESTLRGTGPRAGPSPSDAAPSAAPFTTPRATAPLAGAGRLMVVAPQSPAQAWGPSELRDLALPSPLGIPGQPPSPAFSVAPGALPPLSPLSPLVSHAPHAPHHLQHLSAESFGRSPWPHQAAAAPLARRPAPRRFWRAPSASRVRMAAAELSLQLRMLLQAGVPRSRRPAVWAALLGVRRMSAPGSYRRLVEVALGDQAWDEEAPLPAGCELDDLGDLSVEEDEGEEGDDEEEGAGERTSSGDGADAPARASATVAVDGPPPPTADVPRGLELECAAAGPFDERSGCFADDEASARGHGGRESFPGASGLGLGHDAPSASATASASRAVPPLKLPLHSEVSLAANADLRQLLETLHSARSPVEPSTTTDYLASARRALATGNAGGTSVPGPASARVLQLSVRPLRDTTDSDDSFWARRTTQTDSEGVEVGQGAQGGREAHGSEADAGLVRAPAAESSAESVAAPADPSRTPSSDAMPVSARHPTTPGTPEAGAGPGAEVPALSILPESAPSSPASTDSPIVRRAVTQAPGAAGLCASAEPTMTPAGHSPLSAQTATPAGSSPHAVPATSSTAPSPLSGQADTPWRMPPLAPTPADASRAPGAQLPSPASIAAVIRRQSLPLRLEAHARTQRALLAAGQGGDAALGTVPLGLPLAALDADRRADGGEVASVVGCDAASPDLPGGRGAALSPDLPGVVGGPASAFSPAGLPALRLPQATSDALQTPSSIPRTRSSSAASDLRPTGDSPAAVPRRFSLAAPAGVQRRSVSSLQPAHPGEAEPATRDRTASGRAPAGRSRSSSSSSSSSSPSDRVTTSPPGAPLPFPSLRPLPEETLVQIDKDLHRTFPRHRALGRAGRARLRRVLAAMATLDPTAGYCQGMNFIAALLLIALDDDEERALWILAAIVKDVVPGYFAGELLVPRLDSLALAHLARAGRPRLAASLDAMGVDLAGVSLPWLLTLFAACAPAETALRTWDVVLGEGSPAHLVRTGLAIVDLAQAGLVEADDPADAYALLSAAPGLALDASGMVAAAAIGHKGVKDVTLQVLRDKYRAQALTADEEEDDEEDWRALAARSRARPGAARRDSWGGVGSVPGRDSWGGVGSVLGRDSGRDASSVLGRDSAADVPGSGPSQGAGRAGGVVASRDSWASVGGDWESSDPSRSESLSSDRGDAQLPAAARGPGLVPPSPVASPASRAHPHLTHSPSQTANSRIAGISSPGGALEPLRVSEAGGLSFSGALRTLVGAGSARPSEDERVVGEVAGEAAGRELAVDGQGIRRPLESGSETIAEARVSPSPAPEATPPSPVAGEEREPTLAPAADTEANAAASETLEAQAVRPPTTARSEESPLGGPRPEPPSSRDPEADDDAARRRPPETRGADAAIVPASFSAPIVEAALVAPQPHVRPALDGEPSAASSGAPDDLEHCWARIVSQTAQGPGAEAGPAAALLAHPIEDGTSSDGSAGAAGPRSGNVTLAQRTSLLSLPPADASDAAATRARGRAPVVARADAARTASRADSLTASALPAPSNTPQDDSPTRAPHPSPSHSVTDGAPASRPPSSIELPSPLPGAPPQAAFSASGVRRPAPHRRSLSMAHPGEMPRNALEARDRRAVLRRAARAAARGMARVGPEVAAALVTGREGSPERPPGPLARAISAAHQALSASVAMAPRTMPTPKVDELLAEVAAAIREEGLEEQQRREEELEREGRVEASDGDGSSGSPTGTPELERANAEGIANGSREIGERAGREAVVDVGEERPGRDPTAHADAPAPRDLPHATSVPRPSPRSATDATSAHPSRPASAPRRPELSVVLPGNASSRAPPRSPAVRSSFPERFPVPLQRGAERAHPSPQLRGPSGAGASRLSASPRTDLLSTLHRLSPTLGEGFDSSPTSAPRPSPAGRARAGGAFATETSPHAPSVPPPSPAESGMLLAPSPSGSGLLRALSPSVSPHPARQGHPAFSGHAGSASASPGSGARHGRALSLSTAEIAWEVSATSSEGLAPTPSDGGAGPAWGDRAAHGSPSTRSAPHRDLSSVAEGVEEDVATEESGDRGGRSAELGVAVPGVPLPGVGEPPASASRRVPPGAELAPRASSSGADLALRGPPAGAALASHPLPSANTSAESVPSATASLDLLAMPSVDQEGSGSSLASQPSSTAVSSSLDALASAALTSALGAPPAAAAVSSSLPGPSAAGLSAAHPPGSTAPVSAASLSSSDAALLTQVNKVRADVARRREAVAALRREAEAAEAEAQHLEDEAAAKAKLLEASEMELDELRQAVGRENALVPLLIHEATTINM